MDSTTNILNVFDAHSGRLVRSIPNSSEEQVNSTIAQLIGDDTKFFLLEKSSAHNYTQFTDDASNLEATPITPTTPTTTLFLYNTTATTATNNTATSPPQLTTNEDEQQQEQQEQEQLSIDCLENMTSNKATELMNAIRQQQALETLAKHLLNLELVKYKEQYVLIKSCIAEVEEFLRQVVPEGVESLINQLHKTKCLPGSDTKCETLLDLLNSYKGTKEEELLRQDENNIKSRLQICKQCETIQTITLDSCEKRLLTLQSQIGHCTEGDELIDEVEVILKDQAIVLQQYYSTKSSSSLAKAEMPDDDAFDRIEQSIYGMNEEMAANEHLRRSFTQIKQLYDKFRKSQTQVLDASESNTLHQLLSWKSRITSFISALSNHVSSKTHEYAMNHLRCVSSLPSLYQKAKEEIARRKHFHDGLDKEVITFYDMLRLITYKETVERNRFREMLNKQVPASDDHMLLVFEHLGISEHADNIALPPLQHFMISKSPLLDNLSDTVLRDDEWEELGAADYSGFDEIDSVSSADEQATSEQDMINHFGAVSVLFDAALDRVKQIDSVPSTNHQEKKEEKFLKHQEVEQTKEVSCVVTTPETPIAASFDPSPIVELEQKNKEQEEIIKQLQEQLELLSRENGILKLDMEALRVKNSDLNIATEQVEQVLRETEISLSEQQQVVQRLTSIVEERDIYVTNQTEQISSITQENNRLREECEQFKRQIEMSHEIASTDRESLKGELIRLNTTIVGLQSEREVFIQKAREYEEEMKEHANRYSSQAERIIALTEHNTDLSDQVAKLNEQTSELSELMGALETEKTHLLNEIESLKVQLEQAKSSVPTPVSIETQSTDTATQQKIKDLQSIVQKSASMVSEYMQKVSLLNKITQDLSKVDARTSTIIAQTDRSLKHKKETEEGNINLKNTNMISQIMVLKSAIYLIADSFFQVCSPLDEQLFISHFKLIDAYSRQMTQLLSDVSDNCLLQFQVEEQRENTPSAPVDDSIKVSLNNFKEDDRIVFFRSTRNKDAFEAFSVGSPGFYLSPDSVEVMKQRFGANFASHYYAIGRIVYMEPATHDVLNIGSAQPYTLVTCTFE